jgi:hypothetical protein
VFVGEEEGVIVNVLDSVTLLKGDLVAVCEGEADGVHELDGV